ncbi:hypothetical protein [Marivirga arenosa]|uniref:Glycosyl hydrolase family 88 n=1 Tax=Marivirga arenosa TaxID=3059076 RepID=A0AA51ZVR2_9BACT|nr:hypothetical protein [Marivirga sp. BKB1-2]WNB17626.1 hypothetical protein QYS47_34500 [Marivirga sp. BKB1-2]
MRFTLLISFYLFFSISTFSQINERYANELHQKTTNYISKSLNYLKSRQLKENDSIFKFKGEWETQMSMNFWFPMLGNETSAYDSNCFSTATIHNILAEIYLNYPEYEQIPLMLDLAFQRILAYKTGYTFNFWNELPDLKSYRKNKEIEYVRRPNNFSLPVRYIQKAANVADDADDTAAGLMAIYYQNKINDQNIPDSLNDIHKIFDQYIDYNRNNRNWYNVWQGQGINTKAYLTWFGEEHSETRPWNILREFLHQISLLTPLSKMYPHAGEPYIPYGSNDIDIVVNMNILRMFSLYDNNESLVKHYSAAFVEDQILKEKFDYKAVYYPNQFHIPYYVTKAYHSGVKELEKSSKIVEKFILQEFEENGHWVSRSGINKGDSLQSTIYAVSALLNSGGLNSAKSEKAIVAGLDSILSKSIETDNEMHWTGGVFFSGGTVVRDVLHWKSDAVTTALVLELLVNLRSHLENKYPELKD